MFVNRARALGATALLAAFILLVALALAGGTVAADSQRAGPQSLPTEADWTYSPHQADAWFGEAVASAGDVNGDGYDDVIVGASRYDGVYTDEGRAFLFFGSADGLSLAPDWIAEPPYHNLNGFFGWPVAGAGDLNGDGYDDVIVGMTNYEGGVATFADEGAAFVYYGSPTGPSLTPDWMAEGDATYAHLGWSVGSAGDVNDDGYDDIIVGAYRYDYNNISHAYVWLGAADGLGANGTPANADWVAAAPQYNADGYEFGGFVGTVGDVNDDGFDDVFVGAAQYTNGQSKEGAIFVWYGAADGLGDPGTIANADWRAESDQADARLSRAAGPGDVNGDGVDDLLAGAYRYTASAAGAGAAFVWYGAAGGPGETGTPANADWSASPEQDNASFAISLSGAGDVNGDGIGDILVGARYFSNPEVSEGCAFVYLGASAGPELAPAWTAESNQASALYGRFVSGAGDVNGDELDDVVIGAYYFDAPESDAGQAYAYYGAQAIAGLTAVDDGPTALGEPTSFAAGVVAGNDVDFAWDLGDGATMSGAEISHTYAAAGIYTATVTATNRISQAVVDTVVVVQEAVADLQIQCDSPVFLGQPATCAASVGAGTDVSFAWTFGDGADGVGAETNHLFPAIDAFTVTVTAANLVGAADASTVVVVEGGLFLPALLTSD